MTIVEILKAYKDIDYKLRKFAELYGKVIGEIPASTSYINIEFDGISSEEYGHKEAVWFTWGRAGYDEAELFSIPFDAINDMDNPKWQEELKKVEEKEAAMLKENKRQAYLQLKKEFENE